MIPPTVPLPEWFNARVVEWHDGDTGTFAVDRGEGDSSTWHIRILGCNAIELADPGGPEAHEALTARLPAGSPVVLAEVAPDKYGGRRDARIFYDGPAGTVRDLAADLITDGWAARWSGVGKRPVPPWPRP